MYGANWKIKTLSGAVIGVIKEKINECMTTSIETKWDISGHKKMFTNLLASIKSENSNETDEQHSEHMEPADQD